MRAGAWRVSQLQIGMECTALFSPCRTWRYSLTRVWETGAPACMFIGLNPSTADEATNDPTVRRCIRFAHDWGYGSLVMTNMFGLRSTNPKGLLSADDPVGPDNDQALRAHAERAGLIIAAWGQWGTKLRSHARRPWHLADLLAPMRMHCLGTTRDGQPLHPLYLAASLKPEPWSPA
jgi:hypothetical protein